MASTITSSSTTTTTTQTPSSSSEEHSGINDLSNGLKIVPPPAPAVEAATTETTARTMAADHYYLTNSKSYNVYSSQPSLSSQTAAVSFTSQPSIGGNDRVKGTSLRGQGRGAPGATPGSVTFVIEEDNCVITLDRSLSDSNLDGSNNSSRSSRTTHCHIGPRGSGIDKKARFRLLLASFLCMIFMIGECVGGVMAHSLAVVSDAAHMLTDFASFMISLLALYLVSKPATKRLSFGWHRAEILGALVSILMLWVITGILVYSAVLRVKSGDYEIDATIMLITSATGVVFNLVLGTTLHQHGHSHGGGGGHGHSHKGGHGHSEGHGHKDQGHSDTDDNSPLIDGNNARGGEVPSTLGGGGGGGGYGSISQCEAAAMNNKKAATKGKGGKKHGHGHDQGSNINVKAAFIHVVGDLCQSIGVLVAAIIIYFKPEWKIADPICTFLFSILVLITTINIMRDILVVLMEGTPRNINFEEVRDTMLEMDGVRDLHDLRVWSLTMDKTALSVHLAVERGVGPMEVVQRASQVIQQKYNISQTTMQVEEYSEEMDNCTQCQDLKD